MGWLIPREMQRRPGTPGVIVILADVTPSISQANRSRICSEATKILSARPRARLLAFGELVVDITGDPSRMTEHTLWDCFNWQRWGDAKDDWKRRNGTEGTFIGKALAVAAQCNPEETIVLSDGATADKREMFRIADQMTGIIHAYYCEPRREEYQLDTHYASEDEMWRYFSKGADKAAMQELARRGCGTFEVYPSRRGIYSDYGIREGHMRRPIQIPGTAVNINAPQTEVHRVGRDIHIIHQDTIHHHYADPEEIHHGQAAPIDIDIGPAQVTVDRPDGYVVKDHRPELPPRGFWGYLFLGEGKQQSLPVPPQESYRGTLQATNAPAISGPSQGQRALPSPAQSQMPALGSVVVRSVPKKVR